MHYRYLTNSMRDALIAHIDGPVAVNNKNQALFASQHSLLTRGLLRNAAHGARTNRPQATELTEAGRTTLAGMLGDYADALVAAGIEELSQIEGLAEMLKRRLGNRPASVLPESSRPARTPPDLARSMKPAG